MSEYRCIPLTPEQSEDQSSRAGIISAYKAAGFDFLFSHMIQLQQPSGLFGKSVRISDVETMLFVRDPLYDVDTVSGLDQLPDSELNGAAAAIDKAASWIRAGEIPHDPILERFHPAVSQQTASSYVNREEKVPQPVQRQIPQEYAESSHTGGQGKRLMKIGLVLSGVALLGLIFTFILHDPKKPLPDVPVPEKSEEELSIEEESSEQKEESKEVEKETEFKQNGVLYFLGEKSAKVIGFDENLDRKSGGILSVSGKINDLLVTEIADGAFRGLSDVPFIRIPESVTKIGSGIFQDSDISYVFCKKGSIAELYAQQNNLNTLPYSGENDFDRLEYFPRSMNSNVSLFAVSASSGTDVRGGPGTEYPSFNSLAKGSIHAVLLEEKGWSLVRVDNKYGWIDAKDLTLAEDYSGEIFTYSNSFFSLQIPSGWEDLYQVQEKDGVTTFYHAPSVRSGYSGLLFGIHVTQDSHDMNDYPESEILSSKFGYYYILFYPTDTAYDSSDAIASAEYRYMGECIREILNSIVWKDTGYEQNFEKLFAQNPIDQACVKEHQTIDTAEEGAQVYEKYASLWASEIEYAYDQLLSSYPSSSVEYTEAKTAQQAWQNSSAPLLQAALDAAGASSENPDPEIIAAAKYAFYYTKAREVYQKLYNVFPDYVYLYQS